MKYFWSFCLLVLMVDWLNCSSPSRDPGPRHRKSRPRAGSTTTNPTLLNGSTTSDTVVSTQSSSQGEPDVSNHEKAGPHPDGMTTPISAKNAYFNNFTAVEDDGVRVTSVDLNHGTWTTKSFGQRRPPKTDIRETTRGPSIITSSSASILSASPSSLLSPAPAQAVVTTSDDAVTSATVTTTSPTVFTSVTSSRANVTTVATAALTQRGPHELATVTGDCVSSTDASSSAERGTVVAAAAAAANSHSASSASPSGLTQHPASSSRRAVLAGAAVALARTACAPCDVRLCQPVFPESCQGLIRKDSCSCCPICSSYEDADTGMLTTPAGAPSGASSSAGSANVCDSIRCPRGRVCLLNIQGLPMCRCPSVFQCRRLPDRPVCSTDGRTFKNRCFLGVEECVSARTLSIAREGFCDTEVMMTTNFLRQQSTPAPPATSAFRFHTHQSHVLMSDERVRHQGNRGRHRAERSRRRPSHRRQQHQQQQEVRRHDRQSITGVAAAAAADRRRPDANQAKRKSHGQRD